jgi:hypothetical protein
LITLPKEWQGTTNIKVLFDYIRIVIIACLLLPTYPPPSSEILLDSQVIIF